MLETRMLGATKNLKALGYDFFDDLRPDLTIEEFGNRYGELLKIPSMPLVQKLIPKHKESEPLNTYSGIFGTGVFPFHSDMAHWYRPPRYLILRCSVPDEHVTTRLVQANQVIPRHDTITAKRALFKPRRKLDGKSYLLKLSDPELFRWDSVFIEPANAEAVELSVDIQARLAVEDFVEFRFSNEGQVLMIDNWKMLHARSTVGELSCAREIERVYLETVCL